MTLRLLFCILVLAFHGLSAAQTAPDKNYFLRHSLIFFADETPFVTPSNIVFTQRSICGFSQAAYKSPILQRGTHVNIVSVDRDQNPAHVVFSVDNRNYGIDLENRSKTEFQRSLDLAFSVKKREFGFGHVRNRSDAVREYGFPVAKCADDGGWFYFLEFSPVACGSFDGCVINFTKKGLSVYGYI